MISYDELDEMSRIAKTDPGMADLLDRLHEYYLLKRPTPPPSHSANDILSKIRARATVSQPAIPSPAFRPYVLQHRQRLSMQ